MLSCAGLLTTFISRIQQKITTKVDEKVWVDSNFAKYGSYFSRILKAPAYLPVMPIGGRGLTYEFSVVCRGIARLPLGTKKEQTYSGVPAFGSTTVLNKSLYISVRSSALPLQQHSRHDDAG